MKRLGSKLAALFGRRRMDAELDEELRVHLEMQIEENRRLGMSPEEARRVALRDLGGVEQAKEAHRETRGLAWLEALGKDLRYALRGFRRSPGFALSAVLILALGVGANTAVFSLLDQILLRPLDLPDADHLVSIYHWNPEKSFLSSTSYPNYEFYRDNNRVFEGLTAFVRVPTSLRLGEHAERISVELVTAEYFSVLGVRPAAGRFFLPEEGERDGEHPVVVLSHEFWRERFQGDPATVGQTVRLHDTSFTVIGVAPAGFRGVVLDWGDRPAMWIPLTMRSQAVPAFTSRFDIVHLRTADSFLVTGRLRDGISIEEARAGMLTQRANLVRAYPHEFGHHEIRLLPTNQSQFWPTYRGSILTYFGLLTTAVGLILLLACTNIASLLLVRSHHRRGEFAVRLAMGASRLRLTAQLLTESLLLAVSGGFAGLLVAHWTLRAVSSFHQPFGLPLAVDYSLDGRAMLFALGVSCITGLFFGLAPVRQSLRFGLVDTLKAAGNAGGRRFGLAEGLVVVQVAITLVLLAGAGLFIRTLERARSVDVTGSPENILMTQLNLTTHGYSPEDGGRLNLRLLREAATLPGVQTAVLTQDLPFDGRRNARSIWLTDPEQDQSVDINLVTPGYFEMLGLPLLSGRRFSERDNAGALPVAIVSARMARHFWPGEEPTGKRFLMKGFGDEPSAVEVVGVVRDDTLTRNFRGSAQPRFYVPLAQHTSWNATLLLRTDLPPPVVVGGLRQLLRELDPALPLGEIRTMRAHRDRAMSKERLAAFLLTALGAVALAMAVVGVYGIVAFAVGLRTREIGIRMALGAQRASVLAMELRRGVTLALAGSAIGVVVAILSGRWMESLLFGVTSTDPVVLLAVPAVLVASAALAAGIPARRAARTDPAQVLRHE